ncbi:hypothetical protein OZ410_14365 [Robiginitalea sp. M366]|uniref:hypothetical protein n=1 Tax=Robiginitalea aestuariiviva TaxID=3036903 RepID=UPI00240E6E20|nr:hypothetical protein [Robiginitalea aestuariiviva]MDG1573511.1 hypothetical protein [Robiginitalea aestuariiviva]
MIAVLTADLINSAAHPPADWLPPLKALLSRKGKSPSDWVIYRGDELQLRLDPKDALRIAFRLKALVRTFSGMDIRIAIGLGGENHHATNLSESNGGAYRHSGRLFEQLKTRKIHLQVASGAAAPDRTLNLMLRLALQFMDQWTQVSAEMAGMVLDHPEASQQELANSLGIRQPAVSQRQSRARLDLVWELLEYYQTDYLKTLPPCS